MTKLTPSCFVQAGVGEQGVSASNRPHASAVVRSLRVRPAVAASRLDAVLSHQHQVEGGFAAAVGAVGGEERSHGGDAADAESVAAFAASSLLETRLSEDGYKGGSSESLQTGEESVRGGAGRLLPRAFRDALATGDEPLRGGRAHGAGGGDEARVRVLERGAGAAIWVPAVESAGFCGGVGGRVSSSRDGESALHGVYASRRERRDAEECNARRDAVLQGEGGRRGEGGVFCERGGECSSDVRERRRGEV